MFDSGFAMVIGGFAANHHSNGSLLLLLTIGVAGDAWPGACSVVHTGVMGFVAVIRVDTSMEIDDRALGRWQ